ncbi:energy transducer TonB [Cupriavidus sp. 8B]
MRGAGSVLAIALASWACTAAWGQGVPAGQVFVEGETTENRGALAQLQAAAAGPAISDGAYAIAVRDRVKPFIQYSRPADLATNPTAVVRVSLGPGGEVLDAVLQQRSGDTKWDFAALNAVVQASPLPPYPGKGRAAFTITFRPLE